MSIDHLDDEHDDRPDLGDIDECDPADDEPDEAASRLARFRPSREWLMKAADLEDACGCTSVGGLAVELGLYRAPEPLDAPPARNPSTGFPDFAGAPTYTTGDGIGWEDMDRRD